MTLNGRYALYCRKDSSLKSHHKNWNEDKTHTISGKNVSQWSSFLRYTVYRGLQILVEVPWDGAWNDSVVVDTAIFSVFAEYFFGNFRNEASIIT